MTGPISIVPGDVTDARMVHLVADHLADMHATSPTESVHALDLSGLVGPALTLWGLVEGDRLVGCVALKELDPQHGELKSMRIDSAARGRGFGSLLLDHVVDESRRRDYRRVSLETGTADFFRPARSLYARYGFTECGPFADYVTDPNSVFMTRELVSTPQHT